MRKAISYWAIRVSISDPHIVELHFIHSRYVIQGFTTQLGTHSVGIVQIQNGVLAASKFDPLMQSAETRSQVYRQGWPPLWEVIATKAGDFVLCFNP